MEQAINFQVCGCIQELDLHVSECVLAQMSSSIYQPIVSSNIMVLSELGKDVEINSNRRLAGNNGRRKQKKRGIMFKDNFLMPHSKFNSRQKAFHGFYFKFK